jgi:hypothetical protein
MYKRDRSYTTLLLLIEESCSLVQLIYHKMKFDIKPLITVFNKEEQEALKKITFE